MQTKIEIYFLWKTSSDNLILQFCRFGRNNVMHQMNLFLAQGLFFNRCLFGTNTS